MCPQLHGKNQSRVMADKDRSSPRPAISSSFKQQGNCLQKDTENRTVETFSTLGPLRRLANEATVNDPVKICYQQVYVK